MIKHHWIDSLSGVDWRCKKGVTDDRYSAEMEEIDEISIIIIITRSSLSSNENSPFVLPNLTKTLGWVGKQIWERSPKKELCCCWGLPLLGLVF